jgi:hypothetical protein
VAEIQADMAMPAKSGADQRPVRSQANSRSRRARQQSTTARVESNTAAVSPLGARKTSAPHNAKRALAEQLSAPVSAAAPKTAR